MTISVDSRTVSSNTFTKPKESRCTTVALRSRGVAGIVKPQRRCSARAIYTTSLMWIRPGAWLCDQYDVRSGERFVDHEDWRHLYTVRRPARPRLPFHVSPRRILPFHVSPIRVTPVHVSPIRVRHARPHLTHPHLTHPHLSHPHLTCPHLTGPCLAPSPRSMMSPRRSLVDCEADSAKLCTIKSNRFSAERPLLLTTRATGESGSKSILFPNEYLHLAFSYVFMLHLCCLAQ